MLFICRNFFVYSLLVLSLVVKAEVCATHDLNCLHLASILLTPKGVERLLKEQLDFNLLNNEARVEIKDNLKRQPGIILYKSRLDCEKELSPSQYAEKISGLKSPLSNCAYYPILQQNGSEIKPIKYVLFQIRLDNFDAKKTNFTVKNIECPTAQSCSAKVLAQQISATGQVIIETLDGEPLETPRLELINKPGQIPATVQFNLKLKPNGEMTSALSSFGKLNLQLNNAELKTAVIDTQGRVLSEQETNSLQVQQAQKLRGEHFRDRFSNGESTLLSDEVARFNVSQKIKGLPPVSLSTFQTALLKWKKNPKNYPTVFNQLPSFQNTSENAAAQTKGFSTPLTESLFDSYVNVINNNFASDPKVQALVTAQLNQVLKQTEIGINRNLKQISGDLGKTFIQAHNLPVADVANLVRLHDVEQLIAVNDRIINAGSTSELKLILRNTNKRLEAERDILNKKLDNGRTLAVITRPFFDQLNDMNRIGLFEGGKTCPPPTKILKQGVTDKSQLNGAEFGFELTMESLQGYINEIYRDSPTICLGSAKPNCDNGKILKLSENPKILLTNDGKYRMQLNGVNLENTTLSPTIGVSVDLNIGQCKTSSSNGNNQVCLSFKNPTVDKKSFAIELHDAFSWFVKTSNQQVKEGFDGISEINLNQLLPHSVSSSFDIQNPKIIGPQGVLVFPMNLRPQDQRTILGKLK